MNDDLEITYTTSRVDQDCRCCRCGNDDTIANMLKVVWGNDMTVSIKLAVKEDDQYVDYDLTDVEDMVVNVVSPYQDRIQVDSFITANKIQAIIDSNVLESNVPYGIELIWKDGPYDKRAFAKNMFMFVNSSIEATDSAYRYDPQNPYEYNIIMENDTCYISIGQIPEIDLSNYVTQGELTSSLDQLWQDCNNEFIDHEELADAISDLDLSDYVTQISLNTTLQDYVQTSDLSDYVTESSLNTTLSDYVTSNDLTTTLSDYVTQTSLNTTLQDYVQTSALDDYVTESSLNTTLGGYVTDTELQDAISGVTIDESNLVHKTGNESIAGTKTFTNRVLVQQGMSISGDLLVNSSQSLLSRNVLESAPVSIQTGRISTNQLATSDIIAPSSDYNTSSTSGFSGTKDTIVFSRDVASSPSIVTLQQIAKIDSNGIYEGTTLLEDKYLQIADLPSIPTATSDLTNDSGFITNIDLTTTLSPIESDITSLDGRVTTLEQSGSGVSQEDWDNTNEAIAQELTDNRLAHLDINNKFSNYYTKTDSDSRYATQSWANNKFVTQSDDVNRQQAIAAAFAYLQTYIDSSGGSDIDLSSYVTIDEMNNYSEVVSTALTYHKLDIININEHFNDYYTKTQSDSRYATSNSIAQQYVDNSSLDNLSYVVAASLNDLNDRMPSYTSDLTNDSGFVTSSSVTTIWQGSQVDYDAITTKNPNTLYVIV